MTERTPQDEITTAIDRLTALRDASTPGPWEFREESPSMNGRNWTMRTEGVPGIQISAHEYRHGTENTDLIALLHATIDPLLTLLRRAAVQARSHTDRGLSDSLVRGMLSGEVVLARAINQNGEGQ